MAMTTETSKPHDVPFKPPFRVLLAEDDAEMCRLLAWALSNKGYDVVRCRDGSELMKRIGLLGPQGAANGVDLIVTDVRMPGATGLQILAGAREIDDFPPVMLITAFPDERVRNEAQQLGAVALLSKPFEIDVLLKKVDEIARQTSSGAKQGQQSSATYALPDFPLTISFRGDCAEGPIEAFVRQMAGKLNPFQESISHCRVAVERSSRREKTSRYTVHIEIALRNKLLAIDHQREAVSNHRDPYSVVRRAFTHARRQLKEHLHRHPHSDG